MKILITGANGQLGQDLIKTFADTSRREISAFTKNELDITDEKKVNQIIHHIKPEIVINAAAYTNVDGCETNQKTAYEINSYGALNLAKAVKEIGAKLIHISTDYIFNGKKTEPYVESDLPDPLSLYGKSKLMGERLIQAVLTEYYIVRTSWLYSHHGKNFVKTMLELAKTGKEIVVVNDQVGKPTFTMDLAIAIKQLIEKPYGVYHIANEGACSWFTFAQAIYHQAGFNPALVKPITTEEYGVIAKRPAFSVLGTELIQLNGITMRNWQQALESFIEQEEKEID